MKKLLIFLLLPLQLVAQNHTNQKTDDVLLPDTKELTQFIDSITMSLNKMDAPGAVLLLAKDGKPVYRKAYGMASLELKVPARPDHRFAIGSVSKQFCAVAILQLAMQGKLGLKDDIKKYLPEFNNHDQLITIEHLLTHTSGIPSTENSDWRGYIYETGARSNKDLLQYAGSKELFFKPGVDWSYNNIGYKMSAIIVERISGLSFSDYLTKYIFHPAGMMQTFNAVENMSMINLAPSYAKNNQGDWMLLAGERWSWAKGGGAIISTPDDMLLWDIALREGKVLPKEWLEKAWKPYMLKDGRSTNYGYGWSVQQMGDSRIINHGGAIYGYRTASYHIPEKNIYLLYANYSGATSEEIPAKIIRKLMNLPAPLAEKKLSAPATDYEGVYEIHLAGTRIAKQLSGNPVYQYITAKNDSVFIQTTNGQIFYLKPYGKDCFLAPQGETQRICFNRDGSGKIVSVNTTGIVRNYGPLTNNPKVNQALYKIPEPVKTDTALLKKYAGLYYNTVLDAVINIEYRGGKLLRMDAGIPAELLPLSPHRFAVKNLANAFLEFNANNKNEQVLRLEGLRTHE